MSTTETYVNYVVEAIKGDRAPVTMANVGDHEDLAQRIYESWLASKQAKGMTSIRYRLVKRIAVVTDEVIMEESPSRPVVPDIPKKCRITVFSGDAENLQDLVDSSKPHVV